MPDLNQLQKDIQKLQKEIKTFPKRAGHIVERYSHKAFDNAAWDGKSWDKRKSKDRSDRNNPDKPRALMIKTRALQRSIRVESTADTIKISSNVKYAQIHNEGGTIKHPGGTPYLPFNVRHTAKKSKGRIGNMGDNQMIFIKKSKAAQFPQAKFTKPHNIPIPKRQFMGYSNKLMDEIKQEMDNIVNKKP